MNINSHESAKGADLRLASGAADMRADYFEPVRDLRLRSRLMDDPLINVSRAVRASSPRPADTRLSQGRVFTTFCIRNTAAPRTGVPSRMSVPWISGTPVSL